MARDKKNNKQNNKKNKKGQNQGGADQQQAQNLNQPPPLLTFSSFEEHKAAPAQAFQSKSKSLREAKSKLFQTKSGSMLRYFSQCSASNLIKITRGSIFIYRYYRRSLYLR